MDFRRFSKYSFFLFLFFLPLQTAYLFREVFIGGEKWQYGTIALYGTDILFVVSLVLFLTPRLMRDPTSFFSQCRATFIRTERILFLFVGWSALSILWSFDQALAAYAVAKILVAVGVFFYIRSLNDKDIKTVLNVLIAAAVLQSLLGIWQFLSQSTFASTLLGMSAHEVAAAGTSVLKGWHIRFLRAYGTLPHPNMLGGFLAVMLVMLVARFEVWIKESGSRLAKGAGAFAAILILFGLTVTFSRAAWLGAALSLGLIAIVAYKKRMILTLQLISFLVIGAAVFFGLFHDLVSLRFDSVAIEQERSVSERVQSLEDVKQVINQGKSRKHMLIGTGIGNSTAVAIRIMPQRPVWTVQPAHNVLVLVFAELGVIGLVLFVVFIGSLFVSPGTFAGKMAVLVLLPSFLLDHFLWTSHFGLLFSFLLLGFVAKK